MNRMTPPTPTITVCSNASSFTGRFSAWATDEIASNAATNAPLHLLMTGEYAEG